MSNTELLLGGNVSAGDFVKFIKKIEGEWSNHNVNSTANSGYTISAIALNENKVFIAHNYDYYYWLYGAIVEINETDITVLTDVQLNSNTNAGYKISAVALSENKVFIASCYGANFYLYGMVVEINGTEITAGTNKQLKSITRAGYEVISAITLSDNKVFIAYSGETSNYLYGMVCTIEGTSITVGEDTKLNTGSQSGRAISTIALSENKVFIAHTNANYYLYGRICIIEGTSITVGEDKLLSSSNYSGYRISAVALSENKVFIAHYFSESFGYLYGVIVEINGTEITAGTDVQLSKIVYTGRVTSVVALSNDKVFISHSNSTNYYLYGMICTIEGTSITAGIDVELSTITYTGNTISSVLLNNNIIIAHSYTDDYQLHLTTNMIETSVNILENPNDTIIGVAQSSATDGELVNVVVPDFSESEVN